MKKKYHDYNVLVVEDNIGDFELINFYLKNQISEANIYHVTNFKDAEAHLTNNLTVTDIILLDLSLPDISGEELTQRMISIAHHIPIVVLTGFENLEFSIRSLSMGVSDYLLKDEITSESLYKDIIYSIERKKNSIKIIESEKKYSDLFHLSPQPMVVYDVETLAFLSVNDAAIKSYGYTETELLNMTLNDLCVEKDLPLLQETMLHLKNSKQSISSSTHQIVRKDGSLIDIDIRSNAFHYKNKPARLILATDITERIQYIKAIEKQNKKLQDIAYTQSHIVRAPLARIMALINLLEQLPSSDNTENKELLNYIMESGRELDQVIKDIVNMSEKTVLK